MLRPCVQCGWGLRVCQGQDSFWLFEEFRREIENLFARGFALQAATIPFSFCRPGRFHGWVLWSYVRWLVLCRQSSQQKLVLRLGQLEETNSPRKTEEAVKCSGFLFMTKFSVFLAITLTADFTWQRKLILELEWHIVSFVLLCKIIHASTWPGSSWHSEADTLLLLLQQICLCPSKWW